MIETIRELIFGRTPIIKNNSQLEGLVSSTYVLGFIFAVLVLLIAVIVAQTILSTPGGKHVQKRKMWFWILASVAPILFTLYNFLSASGIIKEGSRLVGKFQTAASINFAVMLVTYVLLGVLLSFLFRKGKLGDWFFSSKKYRS